jgi:hypothetical protein
MVCDDDGDILKLFGQALMSKYNVILVSSGQVCIESSSIGIIHTPDYESL